jgi:hypothetical protein
MLLLRDRGPCFCWAWISRESSGGVKGGGRGQMWKSRHDPRVKHPRACPMQKSTHRALPSGCWSGVIGAPRSRMARDGGTCPGGSAWSRPGHDGESGSGGSLGSDGGATFGKSRHAPRVIAQGMRGLYSAASRRIGQASTGMRGSSNRSVVRAYQPPPCMRPIRSSLGVST